MSIFVHCLCDFPHCNHFQAIYFEGMEETWRDIINALINFGWQIELKDMVVSKSICPLHNLVSSSDNEER